jgi:flagellar basal body-associated protein FliL
MEKETFGQSLKRKSKRTLRIFIGVLVVVLIALFLFYTYAVYDEGVRAGVVVRISKKGVLFKTYEGQLNLESFGALRGTNPIASTFDFSVQSNDEQVIKDLEAASLSGERVNLKYIKRYGLFAWRGETQYFVTAVERATKK